MKKFFVMISAAFLALTAYSCGACCDEKKCEGQEGEHHECCEHRGHHEMDERHAACEAMRAKWEKFDSLSQEEQVALVAERKAMIDEHMARHEEHRAEMDAKRAEHEAQCAEFKAKWEKFDSLSLAEQKALIDELDAHRPEHHSADKPCCHKGCPKHEGECGHHGQK